MLHQHEAYPRARTLCLRAANGVGLMTDEPAEPPSTGHRASLAGQVTEEPGFIGP